MSAPPAKNNRAFKMLLPLPLAMNVALFVLSNSPTLPIETPFLHFDKLAHFGAYFVLCGLWILALSWKHPPLRVSRLLGLALLLTIGYGMLDEIHQLFVPNRFGSLADLLADALGALAAAGLLHRFAPEQLFPALANDHRTPGKS